MEINPPAKYSISKFLPQSINIMSMKKIHKNSYNIIAKVLRNEY